MISSRRSRKRNTSAGRPPARPTDALAGRLDHRPALENAAQVRRRHLVAEGRDVDLAQLRERERRRREREAGFEYESLPRSRSRPRARSRRGRRRSAAARRPDASGCRRARRGRARAARGRGRPSRAPSGGSRSGVAVRGELLEMGDLADVHLRREVPPNRCLQRLAGLEEPAREVPRRRGTALGPAATAAPGGAVTHLEHHREGGVTWSGRLGHEFTTHSQKLAQTRSLDHDMTAFTDFSPPRPSRPCRRRWSPGCGGSDESDR